MSTTLENAQLMQAFSDKYPVRKPEPFYPVTEGRLPILIIVYDSADGCTSAYVVPYDKRLLSMSAEYTLAILDTVDNAEYIISEVSAAVIDATKYSYIIH